MNAKYLKLGLFLLALAAVALGYLELPSGSGPRRSAASSSPARAPGAGSTDAAPSDDVLRVVQDVSIKNFGEVIYRGPVDLSATLERIRAGVGFPHRNDGSVFGNREGLLPRKPRGYYREYVHPTEGIDGPGPQRVVVGEDGDWWYTPDHYASFIPLGADARS